MVGLGVTQLRTDIAMLARFAEALAGFGVRANDDVKEYRKRVTTRHLASWRAMATKDRRGAPSPLEVTSRPGELSAEVGARLREASARFWDDVWSRRGVSGLVGRQYSVFDGAVAGDRRRVAASMAPRIRLTLMREGRDAA